MLSYCYLTLEYEEWRTETEDERSDRAGLIWRPPPCAFQMREACAQEHDTSARRIERGHVLYALSSGERREHEDDKDKTKRRSTHLGPQKAMGWT